MSDLIEREAVLDAICGFCKFETDAERRKACINCLDVKKIKAIPSARPKDEWIARRPSDSGLGVVYECPFCEYEVDCVPTNFCPNCGADMREREGE